MPRKKSRGIQRNPPIAGKRYAVVNCPFCEAQIYKRHLQAHIAKFHAESKTSQTIKAPAKPIESIQFTDLSPEFQEKLKNQYQLDESGFLIPNDGQGDNRIDDMSSDHQKPLDRE